MKRKIIKIDEEKCNGCGLCVPACKEGALKIIEGKAKLVSEIYCDGLGSCIGECPSGALTIEERNADEFDEQATAKHIKQTSKMKHIHTTNTCPGMIAKSLNPTKTDANHPTNLVSELRQWPVQLTLIPANAPYLKNSHLVLLADCTAFAYAAAHAKFIKGKSVAIACPKLDETNPYIEKLTEMIKLNNFKSIEVVIMEVPCCNGLDFIVRRAIEQSDIKVPLKKSVISIEGELL